MPRLRYYVDSMGAVDTTAVLDAGQETANQLGLLRGILKYLQGGGLTPATRTLGLTGIPMSGQMLTFGDGSNSLSFEYVNTLDGYGGMSIPILLGATIAETQTNTATAFNDFVGPKPNVTVTPSGTSLIISSTVLGSAGNVTLGPPATVGVDGGLVPGTDVSAVPAQTTGKYPANATPWTVTATSTADAAASATKSAETGKSHYVTGYMVVLRGANAGNDASVQVLNGATVMVQDYIGSGAVRGSRIAVMFPFPVKVSANTSAVLSVGAAGAAAITELTLLGYTL